MRKTLEDFYYGNIIPNEQDMAPNSELRRAVDRVPASKTNSQSSWTRPDRRRWQNSSNHSTRSTASQRWSTSFWASGWMSG